MSGSWRARADNREQLKPGDLGAGLAELAAGHDALAKALEDLRSDHAGLKARLDKLEEPEPKPAKATRGKADE